MSKIHKLNISQIAAQLPFPFSMVDLASVEDIIISVYICQGMLDWHKHIDNDELFWVHEGNILLESEWGNVEMQPGGAAVVPKGVLHRTSSDIRSSVLLFRCGIMPHRKNGRRRIYAIPGEAQLPQANLHDAVRASTLPFKFETVLTVEDALLQVAWGEGYWPVGARPARTTMYVVLGGSATFVTSQSVLRVSPGELTVIPEGVVYQLNTARNTKLARLVKEERQGKR